MPPRQITVQSVTLNGVHARQDGASYDLSVEYNIVFSDGTGQSRRADRTVNAGSVKNALDTLFADLKTRIGNVEGIVVS